jgi:hypothetical protein
MIIQNSLLFFMKQNTHGGGRRMEMNEVNNMKANSDERSWNAHVSTEIVAIEFV